jgi:hypothetical protein
MACQSTAGAALGALRVHGFSLRGSRECGSLSAWDPPNHPAPAGVKHLHQKSQESVAASCAASWSMRAEGTVAPVWAVPSAAMASSAASPASSPMRR